VNQISRQKKEHIMYARVTTGQCQPGTIDELMPFFESAAHQQQGMQGFVSTQLLIDRTANTFMVVTVCATRVDLEASGTVPRQLMADPRVAAALAGPPVIAVYEVAVQWAAHP
jgi:heme-degrading monooxygenase HmoA